MKVNYLKYLEETISQDKIIISDLKQSYTFKQVKNACEMLLVDLNKNIKKIIAIHANNSIDWVICDLSCQQAGITLLPLPTFFSEEQVQHALESCSVELIITDQPQQISRIYKDTEQIKLAGVKLCLVKIQNKTESSCLPKQTGKITFTSGSTGKPKGVCLSNSQLYQQAKILATTVALKQPRHLCLLPLSTLLENIAGIYAPLLAAGEIIVPGLEEIGFEGSSSINYSMLLGVISKVQPESIILTPELLSILVMGASRLGWKVPLSLKFVAVGGGKVSSKLLEMAKQNNIPVHEGYGLSECASVVSLNTQTDNNQGSCGKALPGTKIIIEHGEIVVKGNIMLGYVNDRDSWYCKSFNTGDLGSLDKEGFVHIEGRKKNLIISSYGRNISPEWIESELCENPIFVEVIVYGDARPFCIALIRTVQSDTSAEAIQAALNQFNQTKPDYARVMAWLPINIALCNQIGLMTKNGKPIRQKIYEKYIDEIESLYSDSSAFIVRKS